MGFPPVRKRAEKGDWKQENERNCQRKQTEGVKEAHTMCCAFSCETSFAGSGAKVHAKVLRALSVALNNNNYESNYCNFFCNSPMSEGGKV